MYKSQWPSGLGAGLQTIDTLHLVGSNPISGKSFDFSSVWPFTLYKQKSLKISISNFHTCCDVGLNLQPFFAFWLVGGF